MSRSDWLLKKGGAMGVSIWQRRWVELCGLEMLYYEDCLSNILERLLALFEHLLDFLNFRLNSILTSWFFCERLLDFLNFL